VSITSPVEGSSFSPGSPITIQATASDSDSNITLVEFFKASIRKLGEDYTEPFEFIWTNAPFGTYIITARAMDNHGATTWSDAVGFSVVGNPDDLDGDGISNEEDNCPNYPNGNNLGTCVKERASVMASYKVGSPKQFITCTTNDDCAVTDGTCDTLQENCNSNGCGDVCECYADYAVDHFVDGDDLSLFKEEMIAQRVLKY